VCEILDAVDELFLCVVDALEGVGEVHDESLVVQLAGLPRVCELL
jgi:hypothetical protein